MGFIREPEGVDFVVEPHEVTEEDRLTMVALIAARKERKKKQQEETSKRRRSYEPLAHRLYAQP